MLRKRGLRTPDSLSHAPEQQVFRGCLYSFLRKLRLPSPIFNFASQKGLHTLDSLSHAPEQQVFRGCLYYQATAPQERLAVLHKERLAVRMRGAPCHPTRHPASSVLDLDLHALDLDLPSARHRQVSRRALFAPALPFPIRRMQTIEKRRCLGCVFCILMHPLRFSPERKRVCMADGNDSAGAKQHGG